MPLPSLLLRSSPFLHPPHTPFFLFTLFASYASCRCCFFFINCSAADEPQDPVVAQSAFMLYGMIHARFIVTARGLEAMVGFLRVLSRRIAGLVVARLFSAGFFSISLLVTPSIPL